MPSTLFSDRGIDGHSPYKRGDWVKIAIHTDAEIRGFFGPYRFLSNIEPCRISYQGLVYPASENAYKATRALPEFRDRFTSCSPLEAIRLGDNLPRLSDKDWREKRLAVMSEVLLIKFSENPSLAQRLLATADAHLEERLWWRDTFWGYDINLKRGENNLGRILMEVRTRLREDLSLLMAPKDA